MLKQLHNIDTLYGYKTYLYIPLVSGRRQPKDMWRGDCKRAENSHISKPERRRCLPPPWPAELKIFPLKIDKLTF